MMLTLGHLLAQGVCESVTTLRTGSHLTSCLNSGEVFQGTWNKMTIALKVLKGGGVAASSAVCSFCRVFAYDDSALPSFTGRPP